MAPLPKIFAVVLASAFISSEINVYGFTQNRSIDINGEMENFSMLVEKLDEILPSNSTSSRVATELSTSCNYGTCLVLCCPSGMAQVGRSCVVDNANSSNLPQVKTTVEKDDVERDKPDWDFHLIFYDPCTIDWMSASVSKNFDLFENGSIYAPDYEEENVLLFDSEHYCLFRNPGSEVYLAKVCRPWIVKVYWQMVCLMLNNFVMLAIFVSYSIVPELKNLHGMVFRSYVATYVIVNLSVIGQQLTVNTRRYPGLFTFFVFSLHYSAGCCALWLNVMSFNIWRTFRGFRSFESSTKEHDRKKFILYGIYAWVTPAVINITTLFIMTYVPYFRNISLSKNIILWTCAGLLSSVVICNGFLFASTALRIRQHKKDTAHLAKGVNKHHEVEKQWFNLHVKLFMITGAHTIMWVIWELWPIAINTDLMVVLEVLQTVLIFIIFIWKANVKRSLNRRISHTVCRLQSTFSPTKATAMTGN